MSEPDYASTTDHSQTSNSHLENSINSHIAHTGKRQKVMDDSVSQVRLMSCAWVWW